MLAFARTHFTMVCVATKWAQGDRERKARVAAKLYKALSAVVGNFRWPSRTGKHHNNNNNRERSSAVLLVPCCCYCFSALCAWFTVVWQNLRSFSLFSGMVSKLPSLSCCCCCTERCASLALLIGLAVCGECEGAAGWWEMSDISRHMRICWKKMRKVIGADKFMYVSFNFACV